MKDDRVYLKHIVECLDAIADYTSEGRGRFLVDRKAQKATLRDLQELAESTQRLSSELNPNIAVALMGGPRWVQNRQPHCSWEST